VVNASESDVPGKEQLRGWGERGTEEEEGGGAESAEGDAGRKKLRMVDEGMEGTVVWLEVRLTGAC
jgi:hypothetical protein